MKKFIALISILFSIHGIIGTLYFYFFSGESLQKFFISSFFFAKPYSFVFLETTVEISRINENSYSSTSISLLNLFFYLSFFIGTILYIISKYKETRLLNFNFSLIFLNFLTVPFHIYFNIHNPLFKNNAISIQSIISILITICIFLFTIYIIKKHLNTNELKTYNESNESDIEKNYLENSSKEKRFLNLIIDNSLIIVVGFSFINIAQYNEFAANLFRNFELTFGEKFSILIYFSSIKFIYYLCFESVFNSTPAKFLTLCKVTDENGENPKFSNILLRTLYRLIPFESLMFLMNNKLHDNYSYTYVINQKESNIKANTYFLFMGIGFITILFIYFYNKN